MKISEKIFLYVSGLSLIGYAYGGKGFAYIEIKPFYIYSLIFTLSIIVLISNPRFFRMVKDPTVTLLALFIIWGTVRTFPYLDFYGVDALRDSVVWAWGSIALIVANIVRRGFPLQTISTWYSVTMKWFVIWVPAAFLMHTYLGDMLPRWPWGPDEGIPVIVFKGGDIAVQLAGILAFSLVIAPAVPGRRARLLAWVTLPCWLFSFLVAATINRGGFLALLMASSFVCFCARLKKVALMGLVFGLLVLLGAFGSAFDLLPEYRSGDRVISIDQLHTNLQSIFSDVDNFGGTGTKHWRLEWWNSIVAYTFDGEHFWTGKGFGINLADDDGFQVTADKSLRSPHNGHLTVLARMGVPGFVLWVLFLLTLLSRLWHKYKLWKRLNDDFQASVCVWALTFLGASLINATFDVFLEGPMGGVWFWSVAGLAMGLIAQRPVAIDAPTRHLMRKTPGAHQNRADSFHIP